MLRWPRDVGAAINVAVADSLDVSAMTLGGSTATTGIDIDDSWAPFLEEDDDMNDSEVKVTSEDDEPSGDGKGSRVHATTVLCPICMKQWLYEIDGLCGCTCGFRLNSRVSPALRAEA